MALAFGPGPGRLLTRRLLPTLSSGLVLLALARLEGEAAGHYATEFGTALLVLIAIAGVAGGLTWAAYQLNRADAARAKSEAARAQLATIVETAQDAIWGKTLDGIVTSWNPAAEAVFGYRADEMIGKAVTVLFPPDHTPEEAAIIERVARGERLAPFESVRRRKDGSMVHVSVGLSPIRGVDGDIVGVSTIVRDISDLKRVEDELRRSNAELEQFAYVASHDLQEPLRTMSSYVQLLARRYRDQLGGDAAEFIDYTVEGADRMQRLIQDLLAYARVSAKELPALATDANAALARTVRDLGSTIAATSAVVTNDALPGVVADPGQLQQLFTNLLSNAIKFRSAETPAVHISASVSENTATFAIRDNGIGIPREHYERVFAVFQRLHRRDAYPGTGIGLAIAKKIVERHGGRIWIESQGRGTTFRFTLPAALPQTT